MPENRDVIIIGGGPAGLTAAIYAARANLHPLVIEGTAPGGQLMITSDVENYPGFRDPLTGPELIAAMRAQAERVGAQIVTNDVTAVDLSKQPFLVSTGQENLLAKSIIIATGAAAKWLGLASEQRLMGRGVSACATCDGFFFRDRDVAVIGGGDTAVEETLYLAKIARSVLLIHRRAELRASKIMQERAAGHAKVNFAWNSVVTEILGEDSVTGIRLQDTRTGATREIPIAGVFIAIGHQPNTALFSRWLECDDSGYLKTVPGTTRTSLPGIFAAGDVQDRVYRQAVTAASSGCMAALETERFLLATPAVV
ncbi:MAG: thioredoxin-disulfide reductase [Cyanobacteria bacterium NC_groundwater_1444_Ag_S-0.65um_54_12]|nr:thioredoxin-disulfide reductase [Cyanobacteria bacterium NC_groundwater_1444_Ag_S-0.65um_54_12]